MRDYFPNEERIVNSLLAAFNINIHFEIEKSPQQDQFFKKRFVKRLVEDHGITEELAEMAVQTWVVCFTGRTLPKGSLTPISLPKKIIAEIEWPSQEQFKSYIACGVGKQDFGFIVSGIKETELCSHPMASIYAVVFAYLQRALDAKPGNYIREHEKRTRFSVNYANVYRLQILLLFLIKNNYSYESLLEVAYEGDKIELDVAVGNINYYARLFCRLANIPYDDIVLVPNSNSQCRISLSELPGCVYVKNCAQRESTHRAMWYAKNIKYDISNENKDVLIMLLEEAFGYNKFNDGQYEALQKILNDDDRHCICIMPTGAGKSLIFYFLALLRACPTFVICPTDLLIRDQLANLKKQHNFDDVIHLQPNMAYSDFIPENKLIYLTPLTFINHQLMRKLVTLNYHEFMGNVILDEVHCISNWSHDFRPEYLMVSFNLREFVDKTGYRCFTATANYTVVRDIQTQLGVNPNDIISYVSLKKGNHHFDFIDCSSQDEICHTSANKIAEFLKYAKHTNRKALVFTKNEAASRALQKEINEDYRDYADIYRSDNEVSYMDFAEGKYNVLIADSDLGIGINLPDVTDTIHLGLPISKSQFVQEIGRAGRKQDDANSVVAFMDKDAYLAEERVFLHRNTPIEKIIALSAQKIKQHDMVDAFEKIFNGIEEQSSYNSNIIKLYTKIQPIQEGCEVQLLTKPEEPYTKQVEKYMRYLYVLYRIGYIYGWYIVKNDEKENTVTFYIDPLSKNKKKPSINEINETTASYLHKMGDYKKVIGDIKNSKTIENTIHLYVDWHYHQFLYHHREQLLEMLDFLETYKNKDEKDVLDALSNYFSLSLIDIQQDSKKAVMLTIKDITSLIVGGVDGRMLDSIRKSNENEYSAKLDYLLFGYNLFALKNADISRLDRVIEQLTEIEFNELLEQIGVFYEASVDMDKLRVLHALCNRAKLKQVIDAVYSKVEKDTVFCGIMALCAMNKMGE